MVLEGCRIYRLSMKAACNIFGGGVCRVWRLIHGVLESKDITLDTNYSLEGVI